MIKLRTTYRGSSESKSFEDYEFSSVGRSNVAYDGLESDCGVLPNEMPDREVFKGGTVSGNICFKVKSGDVRSLLLFHEPMLSFDSTRTFFTLRRIYSELKTWAVLTRTPSGPG